MWRGMLEKERVMKKAMRVAGRVLMVAAALSIATAASAELGRAIQFNLGDSGNVYTGAIAPAYEWSVANPGGQGVLNSITDGTTWNTVSGMYRSGLLYTDGTPAHGVSVTCAVNNYGRAPAGGTPEYAAFRNSVDDWFWVGGAYSWAGEAATTGVLATALMGDILYGSGPHNDPGLLAVRVENLVPGTYQVFVLSATPHEVREVEVKIGLFTSLAQDRWDDPAMGSVVGTAGHTTTDAWTVNRNYVMRELTVAEGDYLVVMARGHNASISGIQIVPVPEPATMCLLALGGLALLRRRGR